MRYIPRSPGHNQEAWCMDDISEALAAATDKRIKEHYSEQPAFADRDPWSLPGWQEWIGRRDIATQGEGCSAVLKTWREGWGTVERMREKLLDATPPAAEGKRKRRVWREDGGDAVDVDRLRSGQPYWEGRGAAKGPPIITLVAQVGGNCTRGAQSLAWASAAILVACERMEAAGYRCAVIFASHNNNAYSDMPGRNLRLVTVKRPQDPVDFGVLVNMGSGWAYRTLWFRLYAGCPLVSHGKPRTIDHVLGQAVGGVPLDHPAFPPNSLLVPTMYNEDDAVAAARQLIERGMGNG